MKKVTKLLGALMLTLSLTLTSPVVMAQTGDNTTSANYDRDDRDDDGDEGQWGLAGLLGLLGLLGLRRRDDHRHRHTTNTNLDR